MKKVLSVIIAAALVMGMSAIALTSASANTTWSLPLDVSDENWHAETWDPAYMWNGPLMEVSDTVIGESTADGKMELKFPSGGRTEMTYPNARYENAGGLITVTEDDYVNIKASCGEKDQKDVRWSITLQFSTNKINLTSAMMEKGYKTINDEGKQLLGGDVEVSFKISEVAKAYYDDPANTADGSYEAIWGPGGNTYLTGVIFYLFSNNRNSEIPLVIESVTIGDEGDFDPTDDTTAAPVSSAASSETSSAAPSTAASSSQASSGTWGTHANSTSTVSTGKSTLPAGAIAAIIVAAVVVLGAAAAVVAVIVVKKNKAKSADAAKTDNAKPEDNAPGGEDKKEDK